MLILKGTRWCALILGFIALSACNWPATKQKTVAPPSIARASTSEPETGWVVSAEATVPRRVTLIGTVYRSQNSNFKYDVQVGAGDRIYADPGTEQITTTLSHQTSWGQHWKAYLTGELRNTAYGTHLRILEAGEANQLEEFVAIGTYRSQPGPGDSGWGQAGLDTMGGRALLLQDLFGSRLGKGNLRTLKDGKYVWVRGLRLPARHSGNATEVIVQEARALPEPAIKDPVSVLGILQDATGLDSNPKEAEYHLTPGRGAKILVVRSRIPEEKIERGRKPQILTGRYHDFGEPRILVLSEPPQNADDPEQVKEVRIPGVLQAGSLPGGWGTHRLLAPTQVDYGIQALEPGLRSALDALVGKTVLIHGKLFRSKATKREAAILTMGVKELPNPSIQAVTTLVGAVVALKENGDYSFAKYSVVTDDGKEWFLRLPADAPGAERAKGLLERICSDPKDLWSCERAQPHQRLLVTGQAISYGQSGIQLIVPSEVHLNRIMKRRFIGKVLPFDPTKVAYSWGTQLFRDSDGTIYRLQGTDSKLREKLAQAEGNLQAIGGEVLVFEEDGGFRGILVREIVSQEKISLRGGLARVSNPVGDWKYELILGGERKRILVRPGNQEIDRSLASRLEELRRGDRRGWSEDISRIDIRVGGSFSDPGEVASESESFVGFTVHQLDLVDQSYLDQFSMGVPVPVMGAPVPGPSYCSLPQEGTNYVASGSCSTSLRRHAFVSFASGYEERYTDAAPEGGHEWLYAADSLVQTQIERLPQSPGSRWALLVSGDTVIHEVFPITDETAPRKSLIGHMLDRTRIDVDGVRYQVSGLDSTNGLNAFTLSHKVQITGRVIRFSSRSDLQGILAVSVAPVGKIFVAGRVTWRGTVAGITHHLEFLNCPVGGPDSYRTCQLDIQDGTAAFEEWSHTMETDVFLEIGAVVKQVNNTHYVVRVDRVIPAKIYNDSWNPGHPNLYGKYFRLPSTDPLGSYSFRTETGDVYTTNFVWTDWSEDFFSGRCSSTFRSALYGRRLALSASNGPNDPKLAQVLGYSGCGCLEK